MVWAPHVAPLAPAPSTVRSTGGDRQGMRRVAAAKAKNVLKRPAAAEVEKRGVVHFFFVGGLLGCLWLLCDTDAVLKNENVELVLDR